jgi:hypothetical protein
MKDLFPGNYRPSENELSQLWSECIFVFDANVLLNLYRYPESARRDLLSILENVSNRIWIPHQVALEFQVNRLQVISEQTSKYGKVDKIVRDAQNKLREQLNGLNLKKRHSRLDPDELLEKLEPIFNQYLKEVDELKSSQQSISDEDPVLEEIDRLFDGKIGPGPASQSVLDNIYKEGSTRYEDRRPPGYLDAGKGEKRESAPYFFGDLKHKREFGDLILWYQLIDQAKADERFKKLIFVTDDKKEDWWWVVAGKTVGPRPELLDELRSKANVEQFYMYNPDRFMQFAKDFLNIEIDDKSINQARDISDYWSELNLWQKNRNPSFHFFRKTLQPRQFGGNLINRLFLKWLNERYPDDLVREIKDYPLDFVRFSDEDDSSVGYDIKLVWNPNDIKSFRIDQERIKEAFDQVLLDKLVIVFISLEVERNRVKLLEERLLQSMPTNVEILFGYIAFDEDTNTAAFVAII